MKNTTQTLISCTLFVFLTHALIAQPTNDECSGAIAVGTLPWTSLAINARPATTIGDPAAPSCQSNIARSIWFTFTPATSGNYYLSTCVADAAGSTMPDIVLGLYTSAGGCSGPFTEVTCDDDGCTLQSVISSVSLTGGTTYYIVAWQYCNACIAPTGADRFIQLFVRAITIPSNNNCGGATVLTAASPSASGNTNDATQSRASCNAGNANDDVWFRFMSGTAPSSSTLTASPSGADPIDDMVMEIFTGSCGTLTSISCVDNGVSGDDEAYVFTPAANTDYFVRVYNYYTERSSDGQFTLSVTSGALPLQLVSFSGKTEIKSNMLLWETLTEKNVQWHIVERSVDGVKWAEVGRKSGQLDSQVALKYELEDRAPLAKAYYRLRSVDFDGTENLSGTVILTRKGEHFGITAVFPSPAKDQATVQFVDLSEETVHIRMTDFTGRLVLEQQYSAENGINEVLLPLTSLQAGMYLVSISNAVSTAEPVRIVKE